MKLYAFVLISFKWPLWKFHCCTRTFTGQTNSNNGSKCSFLLFTFLSTALRSISLSWFLIVTVTCTPFLKLSARQIPQSHTDSCNIWQLTPWQHNCWLCTFSCTAQSRSLDLGPHGSMLCTSWGQSEPWDTPKMQALAQTQHSEPKLFITCVGYSLKRESSSPARFRSRHCRSSEDALNPTHSWTSVQKTSCLWSPVCWGPPLDLSVTHSPMLAALWFQVRCTVLMFQQLCKKSEYLHSLCEDDSEVTHVKERKL